MPSKKAQLAQNSGHKERLGFRLDEQHGKFALTS
jgi:hypothetical protein